MDGLAPHRKLNEPRSREGQEKKGRFVEKKLWVTGAHLKVMGNSLGREPSDILQELD